MSQPDHDPATPGRRDMSTDDLVRPGPDPSDPASPAAATGAAGPVDQDERPLLEPSHAVDYRQRWDSIQTGFVDEPRAAVAEADTLVAEVMQQLAETFSRERGSLESQWDRGGEVSTEDLRVALQRYRSFFNRLLGT